MNGALPPLDYPRGLAWLRQVVEHAPGPITRWIITRAIEVIEEMHADHVRAQAAAARVADRQRSARWRRQCAAP